MYQEIIQLRDGHMRWDTDNGRDNPDYLDLTSICWSPQKHSSSDFVFDINTLIE